MAGFHQAKLNKSVVKDLRKQTLESFGSRGFRLGETAFVSPGDLKNLKRPTELVGRIVDKDKISSTCWLSLYDDGRDSYVESDLHKLILAGEDSLVKSRASIVRSTYEIRDWNRSAAKLGKALGHIIVQRFIAMDHEGRGISSPEYSVVGIAFDGQDLFRPV